MFYQFLYVLGFDINTSYSFIFEKNSLVSSCRSGLRTSKRADSNRSYQRLSILITDCRLSYTSDHSTALIFINGDLPSTSICSPLLTVQDCERTLISKKASIHLSVSRSSTILFIGPRCLQFRFTEECNTWPEYFYILMLPLPLDCCRPLFLEACISNTLPAVKAKLLITAATCIDLK